MKSDYLTPYRQWVKQHGTGFGATLWASPRSQQRRFDVFAEAAFFVGKRVVDAGCGGGDFADYLADHHLDFENYVGIDGLPEIIESAKKIRRPHCRFVCGDFVKDATLFQLGDPQIICISGALNTMTDQQVALVLQHAWFATSETLMFNFLSDCCGAAAPPQDDIARRLNTMGLLKWAFSQTWHVQLRQDYFPTGHDATIIMRKV